MDKLNIKDLPKDYPYPAIWRVWLVNHKRFAFGFPYYQHGIEFHEIEHGTGGVFPGSVFYDIDPQTLTQCTDRADKNGDLIFVGDVLRDKHGIEWAVKNGSHGAFIIVSGLNRLFIRDGFNMEIIGTIWDKDAAA